MKKPQVFVYLTPRTKRLVSDVAGKLNLSESSLFRYLALPQVEAVSKALSKGADPAVLKKRIIKRISNEKSQGA